MDELYNMSIKFTHGFIVSEYATVRRLARGVACRLAE